MFTLLRGESINLSRTLPIKVRDWIPHGNNAIEASTGRSVLAKLLRKLAISGRTQVAVPAYVAEGVIQGILWAGLTPVFYQQTLWLQGDEKSLEQCFGINQRIAACIVIHPFGVIQDITNLRNLCELFEIALVEDFAQSPLIDLHAKYRHGGAAALYSFNKWLPVPDGATASIEEKWGTWSEYSNEPEVSTWQRVSYYRDHLRANRKIIRSYDFSSAEELLKKSEDSYESYYARLSVKHPAGPPATTLSYIEEKFDILQIISRRRENASFLYDALAEADVELIYPRSDWASGYPTAFPILLSNSDQRDKLLKLLRERGVLGHVQREKWEFFAHSGLTHQEEKEFIQRHILLPIGETLSTGEISYIAESIFDIVKSK